MQRRLAVILLYAATMCHYPAYGNPQIFVRSEYRYDAVDYEESTQSFYRIKNSMIFSPRSMLNIAMVCRSSNESRSWTWNLMLMDISPAISLILGHFQVNYGMGLLIGRYMAYNPDRFDYRFSSMQNRIYTPVNSGNPAYAFHGAAAVCNIGLDNMDLTINAYYSVNRRFINEEGYFSGSVSSSIGTIERAYIPDISHTEPVLINNTGLMISISVGEMLLMQVYCISTWVSTPAGSEVLWDGEEDTVRGAVSAAGGAGMIVCYTDRYFSAFVESVITSTHRHTVRGATAVSRGVGALYGFRFNHQRFKLSLVRKKTESSYNAPYNNTIGDRYPESAVFMETGCRVLPFLSAEAYLAVEKRLYPSSSDRELPRTVREGVALNLNFKRIETARISFRTLKKESGGTTELSRQLHQNLRFMAVTNQLYLQAASTYQWERNGPDAFMFSSGVLLKGKPGRSVMFHYARFFMEKKGSMYAVLAPMEGSSIPGIFIRESSDILVCKAHLHWNDITLGVRYLHQFEKNNSQHSTLDLSASGTF